MGFCCCLTLSSKASPRLRDRLDACALPPPTVAPHACRPVSVCSPPHYPSDHTLIPATPATHTPTPSFPQPATSPSPCRIFSIRGLGKLADMTVDLGAYRYVDGRHTLVQGLVRTI